MRYKAVIIEDEIPARDTLKKYLERYFDNIDVIAEIDNVKEAIRFLNDSSADILFMDVQLKDGKAKDILSQIKTDKYKIVYTTAYDDATLEAFRFKSFGYLLKPLDPEDFKKIIRRIIHDLQSESKLENKKVKVKLFDGYKWIDTDDIIRCESESNYTNIITNDSNRCYTISKTLKLVESDLIALPNFIRVHQSHLINIKYITSNEIHNNFILMKNGDRIPVSRSNRKIFYDALNQK